MYSWTACDSFRSLGHRHLTEVDDEKGGRGPLCSPTFLVQSAINVKGPALFIAGGFWGAKGAMKGGSAMAIMAWLRGQLGFRGLLSHPPFNRRG